MRKQPSDVQAASIHVGLVDSGIDTVHPDLRASLHTVWAIGKTGEVTPGTGAAQQGQHGTRTALIIAGSQQGIASGVGLYVAALRPNGYTILQWLTGLDTLLATDIRVLCMPLGLRQPTPIFGPFLAALRQKDVLTIAPSGNDGPGRMRTPAADPYVLAIGASDGQGHPTAYAGSGSQKPDLLAPGEYLTTSATGLTTRFGTGTSVACAQVAGIAARLLTLCPTARAAQLRQVLCATAASSDTMPGGVVDLAAAIHAIQQPLPAIAEQPAPNLSTATWIDSRFARQLAYAGATARLTAIMVPHSALAGSAAPQQSRALCRAVTEQSGCPPLFVHYFRYADAMSVQAYPAFFRALLHHPALWMCSATDINWLTN